MDTFVELEFPELVQDIQEIYEDGIFPLLANTNTSYVRSVFIDKTNPKHSLVRKIYKKYDFLAHHFLAFRLEPRFCTPIHLDGAIPDKGRPISLNIPIYGCTSDCVTEFYDTDIENFWSDQIFQTRWLKSGIEPPKIAEYSLTDNPVMVCPQTPHRINNKSTTVDRISVSWTVRFEWTFQQAVDYFRQQNRLK